MTVRPRGMYGAGRVCAAESPAAGSSGGRWPLLIGVPSPSRSAPALDSIREYGEGQAAPGEGADDHADDHAADHNAEAEAQHAVMWCHVARYELTCGRGDDGGQHEDHGCDALSTRHVGPGSCSGAQPDVFEDSRRNSVQRHGRVSPGKRSDGAHGHWPLCISHQWSHG